MSEIIAATASEVLEGIASAPTSQGYTSIEAWMAASDFERVVTQAEAEAVNMPVYKWDYSAADAFDEVVNETSADGAWQAYKTSGGDISPTGSATQPPVKGANPQTAIKGAGASAAGAGGLLTMSLPTWTAAAAPLLGVALGVGLYELSPNFWYKVSQKLLPFCYPDTQVMPVVTDEDGNTYIDKEAVEALKEVFEEEGVGTGGQRTAPSSTVGGETVPGGSAATVTSGEYIGTSGDQYRIVELQNNSAPVLVFAQNGASNYYFSTAPFEVRQRWINSTAVWQSSSAVTYDGQTIYVATAANSVNPSPFPAIECTTEQRPKVAWNIIYNGTQSGSYPEGTSQWTGSTVDISTLPVTTVYTNPTDSTKTRDYIPVALPTTEGQSLDPATNPDPTTNEDAEEQISPYILPTTADDAFPSGSDSTGEGGQELDKNAPIPMPFPNQYPKIDPQANPNEESDQPPQKLVDIIPPMDIGSITFPSNPSPGDPANVDGGVGGLVSVYNPTYAELQAFSQWLWVTYADATIDKIWNNPFDGIISLHELYATPNKGTRKYIKSGFLVSPVDAVTIPDRYTEINCGTAIFPEYYGNYLDYSPYSKALCYLPFIGVVELNVDDIVGHAVNIRYRVDAYSGATIAIIECAKEGSNAVLYQFSGNCSVQMPIAGGTQAAIKAAQISAGAYQNAYHIAGVSGLLGGMLGGLGSLLAGNIGGAISQAVGGVGRYATEKAFGAANYTSQTVSAKSSVQHSGQFGESFGAMGAKKPYMIIKRPVQVIVQNYQAEYGYPAHKYVTIGECEGYLRCRGVHVNSARATDDEKHHIEELLMQGVFVT